MSLRVKLCASGKCMMDRDRWVLDRLACCCVGSWV